MLKRTGSLYLQCDPSASHYLKVMLNGIFGITNFGNEFVWKRLQPKTIRAAMAAVSIAGLRLELLAGGAVVAR